MLDLILEILKLVEKHIHTNNSTYSYTHGCKELFCAYFIKTKLRNEKNTLKTSILKEDVFKIVVYVILSKLQVITCPIHSDTL